MASNSVNSARPTIGANVGTRSKEIEEHIKSLGNRDPQLFSIALLLMLVLAAGILAMVSPNLTSIPRTFHTNLHLVPQLFFGLITLIILFNVYIVLQKRELGVTRRPLVEELIFSERMKAVSMIDPATQLFNRRAMEQMVAHEIARTNRLGSPLSMLILDIADFEAISAKLAQGSSISDTLLRAERKTFLRKNHFAEGF